MAANFSIIDQFKICFHYQLLYICQFLELFSIIWVQDECLFRLFVYSFVEQKYSTKHLSTGNFWLEEPSRARFCMSKQLYEQVMLL